MVKESYIHIKLDVSLEQVDTLIAVLSEIGFYAFEETGDGLDAYILKKDYRESELNQTLDQFFPGDFIRRSQETIESKDWNAEWEANFDSVIVEEFCEIRPPFRESSNRTLHEVIINPRMAFGTGHHATTWLMVKQCAALEFQGQKVLDMGCGTGILAILAFKLGASEVTGIDVDPWSFENSPDNARLNGIETIEFLHGDASLLPTEPCYDIILANINRNVLLKDRDFYLACLKEGGTIVLSGIYDFDEEILTSHYLAGNLKLTAREDRKEWVSLAFLKTDNNRN